MYMENEGEYGKYIVQELQDPGLETPVFREMYQKFAKRILWIDENVVDGAFQMNTAWYFKPPERHPFIDEHVHGNDELIGFLGSNPDDPYDLGGVIEVTINGEMHRITRSSMIFIPADLPHMPLSIVQVYRPIFHFSVVMSRKYDGTGYK